MAALEAAQQQLEAAVARLEQAASRTLERRRGRAEAGDTSASEQELLRVECERLRQQLEAAQDANGRLATAAEEAERRLEEAIARLDALSGD
jgi:Domain of unknown function (DUF4164)